MKIRINGKLHDSIPGDSDVFRIRDVVLNRFYDGDARPMWIAQRAGFGITGRPCATPGGALRSLAASRRAFALAKTPPGRATLER